MDIIKNDETNIVTAVNAEVVKIKNRNFNFQLRVIHNPLSSSLDNNKISNLIKSHFDMLHDDYQCEDVYKITNGFVCEDGESGGYSEMVIDDMEHFKNEIKDGVVFVVYNMNLSNKLTDTF